MTAADRPSVTDNARAEAERRYPNIQPRALAEAYHEVFVAGAEWAAARAETTTELYPCLPSLGEPCGNCHRCTDPAETTTADAQTGTFEAILAAHRDEYDSDCGMYFGCSCGWDNDDIGSNEGYVEHVAGLLATARTRPTRPAEGEATDLDRLYSTLNLQGVWVLIDEVAGAVCPWCGDPWESEPSCEHAEAIYQHDNRVMAYALEQAANEHFRDAVRAGVGSPSAVSAWLRDRAARLRGGDRDE